MIGKTKIIATIGPASSKPSMLKKLVREGMDVARLNFSHGAHAEHQKVIDLLKTPAFVGKVAILLDLSGPKIRLGRMEKPKQLKKGRLITLTTRKPLTEDELPINYKDLPREISEKDPILLNDGAIRLKISR